MTLIIALIANEIHTKVVGAPFMDTGWIVAVWFIHLAHHSSSSRSS